MPKTVEYLVFIGVSLPLLVSGGWLLHRNEEVKMLLRGTPKLITAGARLGALTGYQWNSHPGTLVLALRAGCPYCKASMGFYGRISDYWRAGKLAAYPLVLFPDDLVEPQPEIRTLQALTGVDFAQTGVMSTPTVLLVDKGGLVLRKWTGQLPTSEEDAVLAAANGPPVRGQ